MKKCHEANLRGDTRPIIADTSARAASGLTNGTVISLLIDAR